MVMRPSASGGCDTAVIGSGFPAITSVGPSPDQLPRDMSDAPGLGSRTTTAVSDGRSAA